VAELPLAAWPAFLPLALVDPYLSALQRVDPLRQVADINPLTRLWRLATWRASYRARG
jgi:phytoene synthase